MPSFEIVLKTFILFRRNGKSNNEQYKILFLEKKYDGLTSFTFMNVVKHTPISKKKAKFIRFMWII